MMYEGSFVSSFSQLIAFVFFIFALSYLSGYFHGQRSKRLNSTALPRHFPHINGSTGHAQCFIWTFDGSLFFRLEYYFDLCTR